MASIGELFKFLGSNPVFLDLCQQADKSANQIIEDAFQNEELIASVRSIVPDDDVIKNKMIVIIGQKRKQTQQKNNDSKNDDKIEEDYNKDIIEFPYKPLNFANVNYLDKHFYIERVDHRIRLVTMDYEMYY
jgi:hypothetical protein